MEDSSSPAHVKALMDSFIRYLKKAKRPKRNHS